DVARLRSEVAIEAMHIGFDRGRTQIALQQRLQMRRQRRGGALVAEDRAYVRGRPTVWLAAALFAAPEIHDKAHAEPIEPGDIGVAGFVKMRGAIKPSARDAA